MNKFAQISLCAVTVFLAAAASGQDTSLEQRKPATDVVAELSTNLQLIESSTELDAAQKAKAIDNYRKAIAAAEAAAGFTAKQNDLQSKIAQVEQETQSISAELSQSPEPPSIDGSARSLKELDSIVQQTSVELETLRQKLAALDEAIAARETRLVELPKEIAAATARLAEVENEINSPTPPDEPQALAAARQALLTQQREAIQSEIDALKQENAWQLTNGELLPLQRNLQKRRLDQLQNEFNLWQRAAAEKRETEVDRAIRQAKLAIKAAPNALKPFAKQNLATAEARRDTESQLSTVTTRHEELTALLTKLNEQFTRTKNEAQTQSTITESVGAVLRQQRNDLPNPEFHENSSKARQREISEIRLKLFLLREEQSQLADLEAATASKLNELGLSTKLESQLKEILADRQELLKGLITDTNALFQTLAKIDGTETSLITTVNSYATFIDERVFWVRSTRPFGPTQIVESWQAVKSLVNSNEWATLPRVLWTHLQRNPILPITCLIVLVPIYVLRLRIQKVTAEYGEKAELGSCRDFNLTVHAMLLTLGVSMMWPGTIYVLGLWLSREAYSQSDFIGPLASGLMAAAAVLLPLEIWRKASRPKGLIESHFGVESRVVVAVRHELRWLTFTLVPLIGIVAAIQSTNNLLYERSIGRVFFVFAMAVLSIFVYRVAHPYRTILQVHLSRRLNSLIYRWRHFWFASLLAIPITLAVLSLFGFHFTALHLASRLQWTCVLLLGFSFLYALALRWVVLSRRRLAIEQARARLAHANDEADATRGAAESPEAQIQQIDLQSVDLQTRRLVRAVSVVVGALVLWSLWADVLPALSVFDDMRAWNVEVPLAVETPNGTDGETTATVTTTIKTVSYADVAIAIVILIGTLLAMRDVPGLLELVLLQHLPLEAALRFAFTTLTRYAIFIVGIIWAFGTIEIGWSKVQWLAAAITVGLGFGLQEIFANFVSGIIILFERPLRAGDIVTIDGVTGTVKNVRMRATIIQDLDRKDFVVPNKDFITGRLLNWTLSDEVSRIVLPVGIAYGSDVAKAKSLVLEAAENHDQIVNDPPPQVTFEEFGESSLNIVLRCFIALQNMPSRLRIVDDLHCAIDRSFRSASIEIPFPQRDLHLRSIDHERSKFKVLSNGAYRDDSGSLPQTTTTSPDE